jgi:hypothetical protein
VWTAVVLWVLLAVPTAVLLGRTIDRADLHESGRRGYSAWTTAAGCSAVAVRDVT